VKDDIEDNEETIAAASLAEEAGESHLQLRRGKKMTRACGKNLLGAS